MKEISTFDIIKKMYSKNMTTEKLRQIFYYGNISKIIESFSENDIKKMWLSYCSEFYVGDEIIYQDKKYVVIKVGEDWIKSMNCKGDTEIQSMQDVEKTGRYFNDIIKVLGKLEEESTGYEK